MLLEPGPATGHWTNPISRRSRVPWDIWGTHNQEGQRVPQGRDTWNSCHSVLTQETLQAPRGPKNLFLGRHSISWVAAFLKLGLSPHALSNLGRLFSSPLANSHYTTSFNLCSTREDFPDSADQNQTPFFPLFYKIVPFSFLLLSVIIFK